MITTLSGSLNTNVSQTHGALMQTLGSTGSGTLGGCDNAIITLMADTNVGMSPTFLKEA